MKTPGIIIAIRCAAPTYARERSSHTTATTATSHHPQRDWLRSATSPHPATTVPSAASSPDRIRSAVPLAG